MEGVTGAFPGQVPDSSGTQAAGSPPASAPSTPLVRHAHAFVPAEQRPCVSPVFPSRLSCSFFWPRNHDHRSRTPPSLTTQAETPHTPASHAHAQALASNRLYAAAYYAALGALSVPPPPLPPPPAASPTVVLVVPAHMTAPGWSVGNAAGAGGVPHHAAPGGGQQPAGGAGAALRDAARQAVVRLQFAHVWLLVKLFLAACVLNPDGSRVKTGVLTACFAAVFLAQIGVLAPLLRRLHQEVAAAAAAVDAAAVANANGARVPHQQGDGAVPRQGAVPVRRTLRQEIGLLIYGFAASLFPNWQPPVPAAGI